MHATILGIDASSTTIGYCLYDGAVLASGELILKSSDIAERCRLAFAQFNGLVELYAQYQIDVIAIESPASPHKGALIPQCRVSGALMVAASLKHLMVIEIPPQKGKQALVGIGNAGKSAMQAVAWARYGVQGEHAADALGIALAAVKLVTVDSVGILAEIREVAL